MRYRVRVDRREGRMRVFCPSNPPLLCSTLRLQASFHLTTALSSLDRSDADVTLREEIREDLVSRFTSGVQLYKRRECVGQWILDQKSRPSHRHALLHCSFDFCSYHGTVRMGEREATALPQVALPRVQSLPCREEIHGLLGEAIQLLPRGIPIGGRDVPWANSRRPGRDRNPAVRGASYKAPVGMSLLSNLSRVANLTCRSQRLKEWFRWQYNPRTRNATAAITKKVLKDIYKPRTRGLKAYEIYAKLYPSKVSDSMDKSCSRDGTGGQRTLATWHAVCKELLANATEEEAHAVEEEMAARALEMDDDDDDEDVENLTPEQLQR